MVGDLAVAHAHAVYGLEVNLAPGRRQSPERPFVRPMVRFVRRHTVAVGNLPMDLRVKIREMRRAVRGINCARRRDPA
jgi:hypothetical protein